MEGLEKLSERHKKPLGVKNAQSVKLPDNLERTGWVHEMLSKSPKSPTREFKGNAFLAAIDIFSHN